MNKKQIENTFRSYDELVAKALNGTTDMPDTDRHSRDKDRSAFFGGTTWAQAVDLATQGDMETARKLANTVYQTATELVVKAKRLDPVYQVDTGCEVDIERFIQDIPETWLAMEETPSTPKQGVNIVINLSVGSQVTAEQINTVAATIGGAVVGLQATGYAVNIFLAGKTMAGDREHSVTISAALNPDGSPLDISKLAASLQPWFHRRIMFSIKEQLDAKARDRFSILAHGNYGYPGWITTDDAERITGSKNAVVLNVKDYVNCPDQAKSEIEKAIG